MGFDLDKKPKLFQTDPSGIYAAWKANAIGRSGKTVREFLEKNWKEDMDTDQTVKLAVTSLLEVVQSGAKNIEIAVMEREKGLRVWTLSVVALGTSLMRLRYWRRRRLRELRRRSRRRKPRLKLRSRSDRAHHRLLRFLQNKCRLVLLEPRSLLYNQIAANAFQQPRQRSDRMVLGLLKGLSLVRNNHNGVRLAKRRHIERWCFRASGLLSSSRSTCPS